jgi:2-keto-4-pentenoate hydratase/2-oxohepta-3-ene-1,7-dioic acid hydratase in catechol pathway
VVEGDRLYDLSDLVDCVTDSWPPVGMLQFIEKFAALRPVIQQRIDSGAGERFDAANLSAPIPWPSKIVAYPANYQLHIAEMASQNRADKNGFFLKASSSISGPNDAIVLPELAGREIHHECELGIVIGRKTRHVSLDAALEAVFGYTCLIDVVVRGDEERVMRKSHDTFCPIGPWLVTRDEIASPGDLDTRLWVNGTLRQHANTRDLIYDIPHMICKAASVATLYPGDIIATGTPDGVGPLADGDEVTISIERIGSMTLAVRSASRP